MPDLSGLLGASAEGGGSSILWSLLFGVLGLGYFSYGKRMRRMLPLGCGLGLMVFPYFVGSTVALCVLGGLLAVLPFLARG